MSELEQNVAISALHSCGYNLFGNSITSSDARFELLRPNASFTLFAPTDTDLYNLGIISKADTYIRFLCRHIALSRHHILSLRRLYPSDLALPTLLPQRSLRIYHHSPDCFLTNGVKVVSPRIFEGLDVVIHGLADGFSNLRRPADQITIALSPSLTSAPISAPEGSVPASGLSMMLTFQAPARLMLVSFLTSLLWPAPTPGSTREKIDQTPWMALNSLDPLVPISGGSCSSGILWPDHL